MGKMWKKNRIAAVSLIRNMRLRYMEDCSWLLRNLTKGKEERIIGGVAMALAVVGFLGTAWIETEGMPSADLQCTQWKWFGASGCMVCLLFGIAMKLMPERMPRLFPEMVSAGIVLVGAVEAVWGLLQVYGNVPSNHSLFPLTGSFYNPGPYSGYVALVFPLGIHGWFRWRNRWRGIPAGCCVAVLFLAACVLPAGMSRAAWMAAGVSSLFVWYMHGRAKVNVWLRRNVRGVVAGGILMAVALMGAYLMKQDSADGRMLIWKVTVRMIAEHPWRGTADFAGAYGEAQERYFAEGDYTGAEARVAGSPEYAFNEYLRLAACAGIPVALLVLGLMGWGFGVGLRKGMFGVCGAWIALAVFAFFSYPMRLPAFWSVGVLLFLCFWVQKSVPLWVNAGGMAVLALVAGVICGKQRVREEACRKWGEARVFYHARAYAAALEEYEKLLPELSDHADFLFELGRICQKTGDYPAADRYLSEAGRYSGDPMILNLLGKNRELWGRPQEADSLYIRAAIRLPGRIYPLYLRAKLHLRYQPERFEELAERMLATEPKVESTAVRQMRTEIRRYLREKKSAVINKRENEIR